MATVGCVLIQGWKDGEIPCWPIPDVILNNPPLVAFGAPSWLRFCPASSFLLLMGLFEGRKNKQTVTRREHINQAQAYLYLTTSPQLLGPGTRPLPNTTEL